MTSVLAIDTATEACSVAWVSDSVERVLERDLPRAHNRHLLAMIDELLGPAGLAQVSHIVCGVGPGSFTGLRIAVATAQGLSWPRDFPVAGFCSLKAQVLSTMKTEALADGWVLSSIDAQIDQLYGRWFRIEGGEITAATAPWIAHPESLPGAPVAASVTPTLTLLGSGARYLERLSVTGWQRVQPEAKPGALPMAYAVHCDPSAVEWSAARALAPSYVQQDVGWKKLAEQGPA